MNENTTLEEALEQLDKDFEEEEIDNEIDTDDAEADDIDFEYDEDGNVIIPEDSDEGDEDAKTDDADKGEGEKQPDDVKAPEADATKAELEKIKAQARKTLEKLGTKIEGDDVLGALVKLAAETEDKTPEEYLAAESEAERLEAAKRLIEKQDSEALLRADLEMLHAKYPETRKYTSIDQLPHCDKFAEKRILGNNAVEAYAATHSDEIVAAAIEEAKKHSLAGTKSHLQSSVPKGAKDDAITIPKRDLADMRESFPGLSDKEIISLYKRVSKK